MADLGSLLGAAGLGGAIGQAVVRLELDSKKYAAELNAAQAQTTASANAMGTGFSKFAGLAKTAMLGAGVALAAFGANSVKAAADLGESLNKAKVVFGTAANSVIAFSETTAQKLGIAQAEALDSGHRYCNHDNDADDKGHDHKNRSDAADPLKDPLQYLDRCAYDCNKPIPRVVPDYLLPTPPYTLALLYPLGATHCRVHDRGRLSSRSHPLAHSGGSIVIGAS